MDCSTRRYFYSFFLRLTSRAWLPRGSPFFLRGGDWSLLRELSEHALQERRREGPRAELKRREADLPEMMRHINNSRKVVKLLNRLT